MLPSDFPSFDSAVEMSRLTIPGRYLVVRTMVELSPVYIHNVYASVDKQDKKTFSSLAMKFESYAIHLVLGDLNTKLELSRFFDRDFELRSESLVLS